MKRIVCVALLIASWTSFCQTHKLAGHESGLSAVPSARDATSFGKPISVEGGTEIIPSNQGFLACTTRFFQTSLRHSNTNDVVQNLQNNLSLGDNAVIVGHGAPGILCTGDGDHCNGDNQLILSEATTASWQPVVQKLSGKFATVTLVGCVVGQGTPGVNLMTALANATNATVRAPDGILSCGPDGVEFFGGSGSWLQVRPHSAPRILQAQSSPSTSPGLYKFMVQSSFVTVKPSDVDLTAFQHRGYQQKEFQSMNVPSARSLLPLIDFAHPLVTKQRPGAIVTGQISLRVNTAKGTVQRNLIVYNDEWFEDRDNLDVFYRATSQFSVALTTMLK